MIAYRIVWSERAEAERDDAFLRLAGYDPDYAGDWLSSLLRQVANIVQRPGPLSHGRDEEACDVYGDEVRRLLYRGPTGRGAPYRILFRVTPPDSEDEEGVVTILRLLHGARPLLPPPDSAD